MGPDVLLRVPLALYRYENELTMAVGSKYGVLICCAVISLSCVSISSLASMWTLCLPCYKGRTFGSSLIEYLPGILPILSGNIFFKSLILWMVLWSCNGEMVLQWEMHDLWSYKGGTAAAVDMF